MSCAPGRRSCSGLHWTSCACNRVALPGLSCDLRRLLRTVSCKHRLHRAPDMFCTSNDVRHPTFSRLTGRSKILRAAGSRPPGSTGSKRREQMSSSGHATLTLAPKSRRLPLPEPSPEPPRPERPASSSPGTDPCTWRCTASRCRRAWRPAASHSARSTCR